MTLPCVVTPRGALKFPLFGTSNGDKAWQAHAWRLGALKFPLFGTSNVWAAIGLRLWISDVWIGKVEIYWQT